MSANKAPFIPAGTAGGDTRGLPALCASSCACAPWPRPGKGRRFSSFYTLLGFFSFLFAPSRILHLPPSTTPFPPQGTVALLGVTGVPCATALSGFPCHPPAGESIMSPSLEDIQWDMAAHGRGPGVGGLGV